MGKKGKMEISGPSRENTWQRFRRLMPVSNQWTYLDNAAVAPLSLPAHEAILQWARDSLELGDVRCTEWSHRVERARGVAARLIHAEPDELAFVPNTTAGINLVAEGILWQEGDNVVTLDNEFPSNLYPWMNLARRGVETRRIRVGSAGVDAARIAEACDRRTRIVTVSWVGYSTGWRIDVAELARVAHERGALLFLDAIQALGLFPLDARGSGVDFLAADGHKWLLGPEGAGIFFVRREHLDRLRPLGVGWNSVVHAHDFSRIELHLRPSAERYEGGTMNTCGILGLGASLQMLEDFGLGPAASPLADRVREITDYACRELSDLGARIVSDRQGEHWSGIVAFDLPGRDPQAVRSRCLQERVVLSCRAGHLRISPHAYADETDIDRLIRALR